MKKNNLKTTFYLVIIVTLSTSYHAHAFVERIVSHTAAYLAGMISYSILDKQMSREKDGVLMTTWKRLSQKTQPILDRIGSKQQAFKGKTIKDVFNMLENKINEIRTKK